MNKRTKGESNELNKTVDKITYYGITQYSCGAGYGGVDYIRLIDDSENTSGGTPLTNGLKIEILWPNNTTSQHEITTTETSDSFYDRDACCTFHTVDVSSYIDIDYNGTILKHIPINKIKDIKARVLFDL